MLYKIKQKKGVGNMSMGVKYKFFKDDFKELCKLYKEEEEEYRKSNKENSLFSSPKETFYSILEDYISYIDAVVSHVVYEKDFFPENVLFEFHSGRLEEYPSAPLTFEKEGHRFEVFREYTDCLYSAYGTKWNGS